MEKKSAPAKKVMVNAAGGMAIKPAAKARPNDKSAAVSRPAGKAASPADAASPKSAVIVKKVRMEGDVAAGTLARAKSLGRAMKAPAKTRKETLVEAPVKSPAARKGKRGDAARSGAPVAKAAAKAPSRELRIFQIHYQPQQLQYLDPEFEPYDNAGDSSPLLEFNVFDKLARLPELAETKLWGAVSWKFGQKAGTTGAAFRKSILANPGYDVYFSNPHLNTEAVYHNLWLQGETAHPNFLVLCREVFQAAGLPLAMLTEMQPTAEFATANYFVGSPAFWARYVAFVKRVLAAIEENASPQAKAMLYSSAADHRGMHGNASYLPFVIERLLSVFLRTDGKALKAFKVSLDNRASESNVHLKLLGEMKDVALKTKSLWLAACWVNYRNLYFVNTYGNDWVKANLRKITPKQIVFADVGADITMGTQPA